MAQKPALSSTEWIDLHCPSLDGQFVFLDPVSWQTFLLTEGAVTILREAARAIEIHQFDAFLDEIESAGEWPPGLKWLVHTLATLHGVEQPALPK